jgi:pilus assembly protein CpaE
MAFNLGIPIAEHATKSPATQAMLSLADTLSGKQQPAKLGLFKQLLSPLLSGA